MAFGNGAYALRAFALRAQLVVINHLAQAFDARSQRFLAVLVEEEFGIGQARAHDALVAANHRTGIRRADVADDQEFVRELARGIEQRKVFLVGLHREDQAFLRHAEELRFELADQHVGAFDQRGHFVEQRVVVNRLDAAADFGCSCRELFDDLGLAFGKAGDHCAVFLQRGGVAVGVFQHDRVHRGFKAMAVRDVAGLQAQRLDGHHRRCRAARPGRAPGAQTSRRSSRRPTGRS
jgi:hypothetical protein